MEFNKKNAAETKYNEKQSRIMSECTTTESLIHDISTQVGTLETKINKVLISENPTASVAESDCEGGSTLTMP